MMRPGFHEIVSGWMLIDDDDDLADRIERSAQWAKRNGPLNGDEESTIRLMIQCQVARGIRRGDFEPFIPADIDDATIREILNFDAKVTP